MPQSTRRQLRPLQSRHGLSGGESAAARVRRRCAFHLPAETREQRHGLASTAVHVDVPHSTEGALERRCVGHRGRLPLHARRTSGALVLPAPRPAGLAPPRTGSGGPRPQDGACHAPRAVLGLAGAVPERATSTRTPGPGPVEDLGRPDRRSEDGPTDRKRPLLIDSFERGKALTLVRNPRYWGPHLARVDHLVLRYHVQDMSTRYGRATSTSCSAPSDRRSRRLPTTPSSELVWLFSRATSTSPCARGKEDIPRSEIPWFAARLPTASTGWPSCGRSAYPTGGRCRVSSTSPRAPTSARTGPATATDLRSLVRCSYGRGASEVLTASSPAPGGGCRCAS